MSGRVAHGRHRHVVERLIGISRRQLAAGLVAAAVAVVLAATLWPAAPVAPPEVQWCLRCGAIAGADLLQNVLLFLPLGAALAALGWGGARTTLAAVLLALVVETLQLTVVPGRTPALRDVITNGTGAALGWGAALGALHVARSSDRMLRLASLVVLALWTAVMVLSTLAQRPSEPSPPFVLHRAPPNERGERFSGEILDVRLGARALDDTLSSAGAAAVLQALRERSLELELAIVADQPHPGFTALAELRGAENVPVISFGIQGSRLVLDVGMHSDRFALRNPRVFLSGILTQDASGSPDTVRLRGGFVDGQLRFRAHADTVDRANVLTPGPALGWAVLAPIETTNALGRFAITLAWITCPLVLTGILAGAGARSLAAARCRRWQLVVAILLAGCILTALVAAPVSVGLRAAPVWTWLLPPLAVTAGWLLFGFLSRGSSSRR